MHGFEAAMSSITWCIAMRITQRFVTEERSFHSIVLESGYVTVQCTDDKAIVPFVSQQLGASYVEVRKRVGCSFRVFYQRAT